MISIALARIAAFVEINALDPRGSNTLSESVRRLIEHYGFTRVPEPTAQLESDTGVKFGDGRLGSIAIDTLHLFHNGLLIDTRSSTDDSRKVLEDVLSLAKELNGAHVVINRHHFISQIVFRSKLNLFFLNPILNPIADRLSKRLSSDLNTLVVFEPTSVIVGPQTWDRKIAPSVFSIERRLEVPFNENTYYSQAPLTTNEHIKFIEEFEIALKK
jgi:hypothetical protein